MATPRHHGGARSGVPAALRFIAAARHDEALIDRLAELDPDRGLASVVRIAAEAGFSLSIADLQTAYVQDWGLRQALATRRPAG